MKKSFAFRHFYCTACKFINTMPNSIALNHMSFITCQECGRPVSLAVPQIRTDNLLDDQTKRTI